MIRYLILARSETTAKALKNCLGVLAGSVEDGECMVLLWERDYGALARRRMNERLASLLDDGCSGGLSCGQLTVLVDSVRVDGLNPLLKDGWEPAIAGMILAFPEFRWVFGLAAGAKGQDMTCPAAKNSQLGCLCWAPCDPLFDESGLRDWVRSCADKAKYVPKREEFALALDDEPSYAYLHAYSAYRFGMRAVVIDSGASAKRLLSKKQEEAKPLPTGEAGADGLAGPSKKQEEDKPLLTLEDIFVSFPDGPAGMSWLDKDSRPGLPEEERKGRSTEWKRLEDAGHRIFITSDLHTDNDKEKRRSNVDYIKTQRTQLKKDIRKVFKPHAGIFSLWRQAGLTRSLKWMGKDGRVRRGVGDGYVWPPPKDLSEDNEHGHSSPGALLEIAQSLIDRAEKLLPGVCTVRDAVRGAVLATDALELLGGRTPTLSIEALRLKHHFEVLAECQFSGVQHHIGLRDRVQEIQRDVAAISRWFGPRRQVCAALNAEMSILLALVRVLRDHGQFDEEDKVMRRVRHLHNTLWMHRNSGGMSWRVLFAPVLRYSEFLLDSFPRFFVSIFVWIFGLTGLFWLTATPGKPPDAPGGADRLDTLIALFESLLGKPPEAPDGAAPLLQSFSQAFLYFSGSEGVVFPGNLAWTFMSVFTVAVGLAHLGIFVSHLYTLVTRK